MQTEDKIIRSATIENMADENGVVNVEQLCNLYNKISAKTIITGFTAVCENGRAMQKFQAGIYNDIQQEAWKKLIQKFKTNNPNKTIIIQLAHTGRQTTRENAVGASNKICTYFRNIVRALKTDEVDFLVNEFATAALRAKEAGFDGCQIHAAHGYLIHQFLSPYTNNRKDEYSDGTLFLEKILRKVRYVTGDDFKLWIKISAADDTGLTLENTIETLKRVEKLIDNVEISYGTMEYALNIIRGACPVDIIFKINPLFNKFPAIIKFIAKKTMVKHFTKVFKPFSYNYNLEAAREIKKHINCPVTLVGGIRNWEDIYNILNSGIDYVSLSRPFICEPDLVDKIKNGTWKKSKCINCNLCTVYCDSENSLKCYRNQ